MKIKLLAQGEHLGAQRWCVHNVEDSHIGVLTYDGNSKWKLDVFGDKSFNFSATCVEAAQVEVERLMSTFDDTEEESKGVGKLDSRNLHSFYEHQLDGYCAFARLLGDEGAYLSVLMQHVALALSRLDTSRQKGGRDELIAILDAKLREVNETQQRAQSALHPIIKHLLDAVRDKKIEIVDLDSPSAHPQKKH